MFTKISTAASGAATQASAATSAASSAVKEAGSKAISSTKESVAQAKELYKQGQLGESLGNVWKDRVDIGGLRDAGFGMVGDAYAERKKAAKIALLNMSKPARMQALLGVREVLKTQAVADPDMWTCCSRRLTDGIDVFWDDLMVYIETIESDSKDAIREKTITDLDTLTNLGDKPICFSPRWWRALILYHYLPFDLSIFGQFKDGLFWILTILSCVTTYGVRVAFFSVLLIFMLTGCPADEYQLVQYILAFKGTQFISSGICMAVYAAVQYYLCVNPGQEHTCDKTGPGVTTGNTSSAIDFFGCCILVWIVFFLLPSSIRSAGLREIAEDPEATDDKKLCCCRWHPGRGGRITGLLGYDFSCFCASLALLAGLAYMTANEQDIPYKEVVHTWEFKTAIFWARIFYSILAFPFIVFMIPGINSILTHTTATGYNRQGVCVPYMLHPMPDAAE
jgi:hypothetical protein